MKRIAFLLLFTAALSAAPRKYIVEFTPATSTARTLRFRAEAANVAEVRHEYTRTFRGAAVELHEGQSPEALAQLPNVAAVYPDTEVVAFSTSGATGAQPVVHRMRANAGGNGIVVAVLDTGIDGTHPALAGKVIGGWDFVNDDADAMDDHRHGTHVAGIIAAQSGQMTGVAPNARLLAYKVLNEEGKGLTSDIIAALERALDPNSDGNLSDRAHIANLSLGSSGHPADPLARAVDNAVAAGMVVVVAAGNSETFHRIGSPAGAAKAITVGASTVEEGVETIAYFSSRGPATQSGAIKPDLVAPGRDIYSTGLGHGYITLSGTSMATPHVAGLAALLLEEHPNWTPERIKSALATTGRAIADEEVMTQGGGIADVTRARANVLVATPTQLNFGLDGGTGATFTSTRRVNVRNDGTTPRTIRPAVHGATSAMTFEIAPQEITLPAGQAADIDFTIRVDHATLGKPSTRSFAFSGVVTFDDVRLPWAFLRAGRATLVADGLVNMMWSSDAPKAASPNSLGAGGFEVLLEPGTFDFVIAAATGGVPRVVVAEQQVVHGDISFNANPDDAPHEIRLATRDAAGRPFPDGDGENTLRSSLLRLVLPHERSIALPPIEGGVLRTSSFSDRYALLATDAFVDRAAARVHVAQYAPLQGVSSDRTLETLPGDYASHQVELHFPPGTAHREVSIMPRDWPRDPTQFGPQPPSLRFASASSTWHGTLYLTRETHEDYASGVQFALYTDPEDFAATLITPMIRRDEHGFLAMRGFDEKPLPVRSVAGEPFVFGRAAIHMPGGLRADATGVFGDAEIYGARGERRRNDSRTGHVRVFDDRDVEVAASPVIDSTFYLPLPRAGRYRAEVKVGPFAFEDRTGEATMTARFDTTVGIGAPPALTSFAVLDGTGRHATRLPVNGNGTLVFSAPVQQTSVFFRRRDRTTWVQLTPVATGEENLEIGVVYRVDLEDALRLGAGEYEIAVNLTDFEGESTSWQIAPAFIAETAPANPRRRAVGK
jgi:Subtilase family